MARKSEADRRQQSRYQSDAEYRAQKKARQGHRYATDAEYRALVIARAKAYYEANKAHVLARMKARYRERPASGRTGVTKP